MNGRRQRPSLYRHLDSSLKALWKRYRRRLARVRADFSEPAVHDLRVDIRRLLSLAEMCGFFFAAKRREKNRRAFKKHLEAFGPLRDTQVQRLLLAPFIADFPAARLYEEHLAGTEPLCWRRLDRRLARFEPSRLDKALDRIRTEIARRHERGLEDRDRARVRAGLQRAFARVEALQRKVDPQRPATIHRVRVSFKRYRYSVEALAPLLPGAVPSRLAAMHDYQALMGDIQDMEVLLAGLREFTRHGISKTEPVLALEAELDRRHTEGVARFLARASELSQYRPAFLWPSPVPSSPAPP